MFSVKAEPNFGQGRHLEFLDVPGVYILIGPPERRHEPDQTFEGRLYIGQSDSVAERLDSHLKSKPWWQTAVIFKRKNMLNLGNCKYLESRLCKLALEAGNWDVTNKVEPHLPSMSRPEIDITEDFLRKIKIFLSAFGWNFLEPAQVNPPTSGGPIDASPLRSPPAELNPVFEELRKALHIFPKAKLIQTRVPDYRAKVVDGEDSRNFAGFKWAKHWFWLTVHDVGKYKVAKPDDINETIRAAIAKAYKTVEEACRRQRRNSM